VNKVSDVARVRRLYRAVATLQEELRARLAAEEVPHQRRTLSYAIGDVQAAYDRLLCAASDLEALEEVSE
jgi:hypothetical protein